MNKSDEVNLIESITEEMLENCCRTCLEQKDLKPIFSINYEQKTVSDLLLYCVSLEVNKEDRMPHQICSSCFCELVRSYVFKQKCRQTNKILQLVLKKLENNKAKQTENMQDVNKTEIKGETALANLSKEENSIPCSEESNNSFVEDKKANLVKKQRKKKQGPLYQCKVCNINFMEIDELKLHKRDVKHPEVRNHPCVVCNKMFTSSKLRQHMRVHTKEKPYQCKKCFKGFSMLCNLKRHIMTHTGEKPFVCDICNKGFIQAVTLAEHKRVHTGEAPFVCSYCGKRFNRSTRHKSHLRQHLKEKHEKNQENDDTNLGNKCGICHRTYASKGILKTHMLRHGEKSFLCSDCGKKFYSKAALLSHSKVHSGVRPYTCTVCQKSFAQSSGLKSHVMIHTCEKPYVCRVCSKSFTQQHHLKYHIRTHSGERPYSCTFCNKSFALKGNLTVHVRTHTGETPYVCGVCGKGYYHLSSMKKHREGHRQYFEEALSECENASEKETIEF